MLDWIDSDPTTAVVKIAIAIAIIALAIKVWFELYIRVRRHGGGPIAGAVTAVGLGALIAALVPGLMDFQTGLIVLVGAFVVLYRPDVLVRFTGGPRKEWSALREGRELALLVTERGGPVAAASDPDVQAKLAGLDSYEAPATSAYLALVRRTALAPADDRSFDADRAALLEADAALRASLGVRPTWEKGLEARARGDAPAE